MPLDTHRARQLLVNGDLRSLFIEELGWDRHAATLEVPLAGSARTLHALAQKRGMVAWHCPTPAGQPLPEYVERRKIEHQVARAAHEHLIVFTDAANETQIWQWVKRELGKPAACREHTFHRSQPGDALLQKLDAIAFTLEEEERVALPDVTGRVRVAFDVERVTKRFYDRFQKEHAVFLKFIAGITETADCEWYASVMLNRLMFVYFIQRKGFLDGDRGYLRNRLGRMRAEHGKDKFYSFYRYFLLRLFHEGLGARMRTPELEKLLGRIPYLNGGIFDLHELEARYPSIQIPDAAFEHIFVFLDGYDWVLDPSHKDLGPQKKEESKKEEISPDVLGYIFEKYINQKQMGAYYTKEDITEYISKNTVLPYLFDAARARCKVAFENPRGPTLWDLLSDDPDRYIYPAARHGASEPLPDEIAAGLNPPTLHQAVGDGPVQTLELRRGWNRPAPPEHALPTETWREVIARRKGYEEVKGRFAACEVRDINDLITLNLDIRQFAQDVIENCEGPELLRAFWHAIEKVTVLDPTCGSGAFLFAALNILEPLYEACLERMEAFVADLDRSGEKHRPEKFSDFRKVLANVAAHPNRRYFIFKSIILNNLYGVDIMEEAVEICKLRLFLKLAAQVEPDTARDNLGIEPLPDIDFNIRAGNTLVGYATYDEVKRAVTSKLDFDNAMEKISVKAADLQQAFDAFRARQVEGDGSVPTEDKQELHKRLNALDEELNRYLAGEYGVSPSKKDAYAKWLKSHQPFHWSVEFYGIMTGGGFDVIIGNPPYIEYAQVSKQYTLRNSELLALGNLHGMVTLRSLALLSDRGGMSMIVPVALPSTDRFLALRDRLECNNTLWLSHYDFRPAKLFEGSEQRLTIVISRPSREPSVFSTKYNRWYVDQRPSLFACLRYTLWRDRTSLRRVWPKLAGEESLLVLRKVAAQAIQVGTLIDRSGEGRLYYKNTGVLYYTMFTRDAPACYINGKPQPSSRETTLRVRSERRQKALHTTLNSSLFFVLYQVHSNCRDLNPSDIQCFRLGQTQLDDAELASLSDRLHKSQQDNSEFRIRRQKLTGEVRLQTFRPSANKPVLDELDTVLARHYGFAEEELDFIINYDIKYRLGRDAEGQHE